MKARLAFFGLVVEDIPRSLAFYRELGLDIPAAADGQGHVDVDLGGGLQMVWDTQDTIRSFDEGWKKPKGGHQVAIAFRCDSPADVDSLVKHLADAGYEVHKQPWDAFWGQRYSIVLDPDGNHVEISAFLEK